MSCAALAAILGVALAREAGAACYDKVNGAQRRFILDGADALDTKTRLIWKRCSLVGWKELRRRTIIQGSGRSCRGGDNFRSGLARALRAELESIVDRSCGQPVVDKTVSPDIAANAEGAAEYWTTNPVGVASLVYFFDFMIGDAWA
jgi:hypothetical protein